MFLWSIFHLSYFYLMTLVHSKEALIETYSMASSNAVTQLQFVTFVFMPLIIFHFKSFVSVDICQRLWNFVTEFQFNLLGKTNSLVKFRDGSFGDVLLEIPLLPSGISANMKKSHEWAVKFPIEIPWVRSTSGISIGNFTAHEWDFWVFVEIPRVSRGIYHEHHEYS